MGCWWEDEIGVLVDVRDCFGTIIAVRFKIAFVRDGEGLISGIAVRTLRVFDAERGRGSHASIMDACRVEIH